MPMHIQAAVIDAAELYCFAEREGIATYNGIQTLIYRNDDPGHNRRHHKWFSQSCFVVGVDEFDERWRDDRINWLPEVEQMVRRYMAKHEIETLVIVTGQDAWITDPLRLTELDAAEEEEEQR
jgi:hypothetical protein